MAPPTRVIGSVAFLELALAFLAVALVAGVLGEREVAGFSMSIAKWLVILFVVLAFVSLLWPG